MLMEIDPLPMRGLLVMISPSRREVSLAEQLRQSPRLVPPRFRLVAAESPPESWLMIFFSHRRTPYSRRWASEGHQGAHEARGVPRGVGRAPHPRAQGVGPLWYFLRLVFIIISKNNFRGVSGLLELCRIGLQYLLLFQPRIPAAGILPLYVNLVK